MRLSVVIPAYNSAAYIAPTLASVAAQTRLPEEVIVADDGSMDATAAVVESFFAEHPRLNGRLLRHPHRGPGATRNAGLRAATGEWIAFLDSDDLWHPEKLSRVETALEANPGANFVCHDEIIRFLDGTTRTSCRAADYPPGEDLALALYRRNFFSTSAVTCQRELVLQWGGFEELLSSAQDYELWLRMAPDLRPLILPEPLGTYVMRVGNITTSRFWHRLLNELRVKHWHRNKVPPSVYVACSARLIAGYVCRFFQRR